MLMISYNKLFTFNLLWATLCIFENQGPHLYMWPLQASIIQKDGALYFLILYVPSDLVSNYGNCNLPVRFIKRKAFLWTIIELTKLEDNVPVPSNMISPAIQL